jgi:hypothetical protein
MKKLAAPITKYHFGSMPNKPEWVYWADESGKPIARILRTELQRLVKGK